MDKGVQYLREAPPINRRNLVRNRYDRRHQILVFLCLHINLFVFLLLPFSLPKMQAMTMKVSLVVASGTDADMHLRRQRIPQ